MATALAAPAHAADIAVPPSYNPPAAYRPALYDWTGIYFGGHLGAGWLNDTFTQTTANGFIAQGASGNVQQAIGVMGGAQLGANWQFSAWVVGAEAAFTASTISQNVVVATLFPPAVERETSNPQWLVTATGRVGYAWDTLLAYVKGGGAWMHVEYTQDTLLTGVTFATSNIVDNRTGFVVGAGLEYGMTENFSAKLEYDFLDFGTKNYNFPLIAAGAPLPTSIKSNVQMLTVGLNYRWNWVGGWH
jgi:outer membrane immunogenic protein